MDLWHKSRNGHHFWFLLPTGLSWLILEIMTMITGKSRGDQTCTTKTPITENVEYKGKTLKVGVSVRDVNTKDIININVFSFSCAIWFLLHTALAAIFSCLVLFEIIKAKYLSTRAYVAFHISFFQCVISCRPC